MDRPSMDLLIWCHRRIVETSVFLLSMTGEVMPEIIWWTVWPWKTFSHIYCCLMHNEFLSPLNGRFLKITSFGETFFLSLNSKVSFKEKKSDVVFTTILLSIIGRKGGNEQNKLNEFYQMNLSELLLLFLLFCLCIHCYMTWLFVWKKIEWLNKTN